MQEQFYHLIQILEIIGTIAFASSGALVAVKHRLDLLGVLTVGIITATGGGMIRDLLIGVHPVSALKNPLYITVAVVTSLCVFLTLIFLRRPRERITRIYDLSMLLCDTIGLGVFTITGITTAICLGYCDQPFLLFFSGLITGVGGGILRDIIVNRRPEIFIGNIYASASAAGAVVFLLLYGHVPFVVSCTISLLTTFLIRICSIKFKWNLPKVGRHTKD